MTTRREYVQGLPNERAYRAQVGKPTQDVDRELERFADGPLGGVIEAAVPTGLSKPKRTKPAKKTATPTPPPSGDGGQGDGQGDGGGSGDGSSKED